MDWSDEVIMSLTNVLKMGRIIEPVKLPSY
jgi:hypothetical protein